MSATTPTSSLYECTVLHERFTPKHHRFVYSLFYFALDLDELASLHRHLALFSVNRANLFSFRESDFLPTGEPLHHRTPPNHQPIDSANLPSLKSRARAFCVAHGADFGAEGQGTSTFGHAFFQASYRLPQLSGHIVEGGGQLATFVTGGNGGLSSQISGGHQFGGFG